MTEFEFRVMVENTLNALPPCDCLAMRHPSQAIIAIIIVIDEDKTPRRFTFHDLVSSGMEDPERALITTTKNPLDRHAFLPGLIPFTRNWKGGGLLYPVISPLAFVVC